MLYTQPRAQPFQVKIGDFGLAKVMPGGCPGSSRDEVPKMSGGVGTWRYMAPEAGAQGHPTPGGLGGWFGGSCPS